MEFSLSPEQKAAQTTARKFSEEEISPQIEAGEEKGVFPRDLVRQMGKLGFFASAFPKEYGGSGLGFLTHGLICEEVSRVWSSLRHLFNTQAMTCPLTIFRHGSDDLKQMFVRPLITAESLGIFALTEPNAGSDVAAIGTRAQKSGGKYLLDGAKTWISNAPIFDAGLVLAKTGNGPKAHQNLSFFLVEKDTPGLSTRALRRKIGNHASPTGEIHFEHSPVPESNRVGREGEGFYIAMESLDRGRLSVSAGALGVAQACLDEAVKYARERVQFGHPIGTYQMVQNIIAGMTVEIEAARFLVYQLGYLLDQNKPCTREAAIAKYFAGEAAVHCANLAAEVHGGYGYSEEYRIARLFRDAKMYQIGEGTANVLKILIANDTLGYKKANRAPSS